MDTLNINAYYLWLWFIGLLIIRYWVGTGLPYLICYHWKRKDWKKFKIQKSFPDRIQLSKEIGLSLITLFIYSLSIWLFQYWISHGKTAFYTNLDSFGYVYFILSIVIMVFLHDTYFYWTHRLLHSKVLYKYIHRTHHRFHNPTPFAAFAFHPLESIISMGIIPIITFTIPWHPVALILFITLMTLYDAFIHLGYNFKTLTISKWQNTPLEHDWHHNHSHGNYGLYFKIWDHLMLTYKK